MSALLALAAGAQVVSSVMEYNSNKKAAEATIEAANTQSFYASLAADTALELGGMDASLMRQQATLMRSEGELNAAFQEKYAKAATASNKMAYIASGVDLAGSPLVAISDMVQTANIELEAYRLSISVRAGLMDYQADIIEANAESEAFSIRTQSELAKKEASNRADMYKDQATMSLINGVAGAATSAYGAQGAPSGAQSVPSGGSAIPKAIPMAIPV